ncbi:MAG: hypothetical protein PHR68_02005 [Candidatus Gracilibacteria bacterium]|nr:hypothetical protein [Candidatus Gracilibacteria bacterium]
MKKVFLILIILIVIITAIFFVFTKLKENGIVCDGYVSFLIETNRSNGSIYLFEQENNFKKKAVPNFCSYEQFHKQFDGEMNKILQSTWGK